MSQYECLYPKAQHLENLLNYLIELPIEVNNLIN